MRFANQAGLLILLITLGYFFLWNRCFSIRGNFTESQIKREKFTALPLALDLLDSLTLTSHKTTEQERLGFEFLYNTFQRRGK